jgi:hypothetical protein
VNALDTEPVNTEGSLRDGHPSRYRASLMIKNNPDGGAVNMAGSNRLVMKPKASDGSSELWERNTG